MKNLLIIGARGFGREVYNLALESIGYESDFIVKGFLDDKTNALDEYVDYPLILDSVENYKIESDDVFIVALGDVNYRKKYVDLLVSKGANFYTLIHKNAYIGKNTKLGDGCIVCDNARISCDVTVGNYVSFQSFSDVGHDAKIGNFCVLGVQTFMGGFSVLEDLVTLHTKSTILPHVYVEKGATVGANSVVLKKVSRGSTMFGIPAKKLNL